MHRKVHMNGDAEHSYPRSNGTTSSGASNIDGEQTIKIDAESNLSDHEEEEQASETLANNLSKDIADSINSRGEIFVTPTTTAGKTLIRVVSGNPAASKEYARKAFEIIVKTTEEVLGKCRQREDLRN